MRFGLGDCLQTWKSSVPGAEGPEAEQVLRGQQSRNSKGRLLGVEL